MHARAIKNEHARYKKRGKKLYKKQFIKNSTDKKRGKKLSANGGKKLFMKKKEFNLFMLYICISL